MRIYQIEVTNRCNLKCSFCPIWQPWADRERGLIDLDLLDRIDFGETEYLELQFGGEPALHPKLTRIAEFVRNKGIKVGISTNATLSVDFEAFDIITVTQDSERSPGKEWVEQPNVYLQRLGENHPYEDYTHSEPCAVPEVKTCKTPFEYVSIHWDGDVVPCCHCFGKQHVFGNLYDMTMSEILGSHKRKVFLKNVPYNYICRYCQFPNPHKIHKKLLRWEINGSK